MINYFAVITTVLVELLYLFKWTECKRLTDSFYIFKNDLHLRLIEATTNDVGQSIILTRLFHNKVSGTVFDLINSYTGFFSLKFLVSFVSLLGLGMFLYGIYEFFRSEKKNHKLIPFLILLVVYPLVEIVFKPDLNVLLKILILYIPFCIFSLFGSKNFLKDNSFFRKIVFLTLLTISLLMLFNLNVYVLNYCFVK